MSFKTTDLCDEHPLAGTLPTAFLDFGGEVSFEGEVLTVKCFEDNSRIKELSQTAGQGRVLVVDGGASQRCALLGDIIAEDLVRHGWAGIVVNGCIRDRAALAQLDLGVKALGSHPRKSNKHAEGQVGNPVEIGGVRIETGHYLYADEDGIVVLPAKV